MCGIAAIIRSHAGPPWSADARARMDRAMDHLARRGPDGRGVHATTHALLGHTRLAIQDLSVAAAQPMVTPDGSLSLVYNGEIYNAPALRTELRSEGRVFRTHSDTEVLLHALDCWGLKETLERIRGMFSFVAVRERAGTVHVMAAVDPAGMKPFVWSVADDPEVRGGKCLLIASDCDAMGHLAAAAPTLNIGALRRVLSVGYVAAPETVWYGVRKLTSGGCLEWTGRASDAPVVSTYWQPPTGADAGHDESSFVPLLRRLATEHLIGDVPVGMFLSAGLDSASIALALHESGAEMSRIQAFTLSTGDPADEAADAGEIARALGMPHRVIPFGTGDLLPSLRAAAACYDEPQGYTALLTATRIAGAMRQAAPDAKVVLSGDGGDESLGGYAWHRDPAAHPLSLLHFHAPTPEAISTHERLARCVAQPDASTREREDAMLALGSLSFAHRAIVRAFGGFHPAEAGALLAADIPASDSLEVASLLEVSDDPKTPMPRRSQRLDIVGFCAGSVQPKLDRACMGVGLELRAPYLDRRMMEWGLARPVDSAELAPGGGKPSIRAMLGRAIERGVLPRRVLDRPKQGFSLRLSDGAFDSLAESIASSRLARDGVLAPRWKSYLTERAESRRTRMFSLAMVAAWYDHRA